MKANMLNMNLLLNSICILFPASLKTAILSSKGSFQLLDDKDMCGIKNETLILF